MALKQDERALIQLVCERGQNYADLAGLLGVSEDEVRAKARSALTELGGADPDREVGLTDYLLGQADPIGRADVVRFLQHDDETRALAAAIAAKLQVLAPAADLPSVPESKGKRSKAAAPSPAEAAAETDSSRRGGPAGISGSPSLPQNRMIAGIAGAAVILIFVVLGVAGVFSGDEDEPSSPAATADGTTDPLDDPQRDVTPVELEAVDGSGVGGEAVFGVIDDATLFVDLSVDGLDPETERGHLYLMWLMLPDDTGFPVPVPIEPNENGRFSERFPIPAEIAPVAAAAQSVRISDSDIREFEGAIQEATEDAPLLPFVGETLAEGEIPASDLPAEGGGGEPTP